MVGCRGWRIRQDIQATLAAGSPVNSYRTSPQTQLPLTIAIEWFAESSTLMDLVVAGLTGVSSVGVAVPQIHE